MSTTRGNLQSDWEGILCEVEDLLGTDKKREIMDALIHEIDVYRNQPWWRRTLNLLPPHWIDEWLRKEPQHYFWKPIWHDVKERLKIKVVE